MNIKKKINSVHRGVKASLAFLLSNIITKGISYLTTPIYTRLLPADVYGKTSVFLTWLQIIGIVSMFCLSYGVFNNGMVDYPQKRDEYSFSMLILSNIITVSTSILVIFANYLFPNLIGLDVTFIILMIVIFLLQPAYNFWTARQRFEYKYKATVFWAIVSAIISPIVAIVCIMNNDGSTLLESRLFGAEIPLIIIYIGFYIYLGINSKWKLEKKYWKSAFLFNLPLIPHYLSTHLLNSSDKLMISKLVNDSATAYYSVAYSVAAIVLIVLTAINGSLIPYTYEKCSERDFKSLNKVTLSIMTVFAACSIIVIMMAPEVVAFMSTNEYQEAIYVIPPIVGGVFFQVQYYVYANVVYYYKKPRYVMYGSVIAVILNLLLNYVFIQKYGYIAAGYTTLFSYAVQAIIDYFAMKKAACRSVYDIRIIVALSVSVLIIALTSNLIYDYTAIRYLILILMVFTCFLFRKKIAAILRTLKSR